MYAISVAYSYVIFNQTELYLFGDILWYFFKSKIFRVLYYLVRIVEDNPP